MEPEPPPYEFVVDPDTDDYHFARHGLTGDEVLDALEESRLTTRGEQDTYSAYGQSRGGRWIRVIYAERNPPTLRIITAYQLGPAALRRLRRRLRKKQ